MFPKTTPADRLTPRQAITILGLSNMGEFQRLRIRFGTDDFPRIASGTFGKAEIAKLKARLDNPSTNAQPSTPNLPTHGRRSGIADRRRMPA